VASIFTCCKLKYPIKEYDYGQIKSLFYAKRKGIVIAKTSVHTALQEGINRDNAIVAMFLPDAQTLFKRHRSEGGRAEVSDVLSTIPLFNCLHFILYKVFLLRKVS